MRIRTLARVALLAGLGFSLGTATARADIIGVLEAPSGYASGISNVQGWAYTDTPGAELIQPFSVLINGVEQFKVPCCGDRGDVQAANPGAPLLSGFSGVYNWGLAWTELNAPLSADAPQGFLGLGTEIIVQVVVTDTMGGLEILTKTVALYHAPATWPRSTLGRWSTTLDPGLVVSEDDAADAPQGGVLLPPVTSDCTLTNNGFYEPNAATLICGNMRFVGPGADPDVENCSTVFFEWDKASQSFKLASDCVSF